MVTDFASNQGPEKRMMMMMMMMMVMMVMMVMMMMMMMMMMVMMMTTLIQPKENRQKISLQGPWTCWNKNLYFDASGR